MPTSHSWRQNHDLQTLAASDGYGLRPPPAARAAAQISARLRAEGTVVQVLVPLAAKSLRAPLEEALAAEQGLEGAVLVEPGAATRDVLAAADLALCKTGSVNVELALLGVPQVACYRVGAISAAIARRLLDFDPDSTHISLVNLVLDELVHPEFVQEACDVSNAEALGVFQALCFEMRLHASHTAPASAGADFLRAAVPQSPRRGLCSRTRAAHGGAQSRHMRACARRSAAAARQTAPPPRCLRRRCRPTGSVCQPTGSTRAAGGTRAGSSSKLGQLLIQRGGCQRAWLALPMLYMLCV